MAAPSGGQSDTGTGVIWLLLGIFLGLSMVWFLAHTQLVAFFFFIKRGEIALLRFWASWFINLEETHQFIITTFPGDVEFKTLTTLAHQVGQYFRYPIMALLTMMGLVMFSRNLVAQFSRKYTTKTLLEAESDLWPHLKAVQNINLVEHDINEGPWAMTAPPMAFAKKHKLIQEQIHVLEEGQLKKDSKITAVLIKSKAAKIFVLQLGPLWTGVHALNDYTRGLFVVFLAKAARDSAVCRKLLRQFAFSSAEGSLDMTGVDEIYEKYKAYAPAIEIINKHAYVYTVMASLLQFARTDGVLATAEFLWLKPIDRRLWYMLNSVGRQTASVEAAGAYAHWLAERSIGRKLRTPMVEQAVKALDLAIHDIVYDPNIPD